MKSTSQQKQDKLSFPCLMKRKTSSSIMLVTGYTQGNNKMYKATIVYSDNQDAIGLYDTCWDTDLFEVYNGEVTLSND